MFRAFDPALSTARQSGYGRAVADLQPRLPLISGIKRPPDVCSGRSPPRLDGRFFSPPPLDASAALLFRQAAAAAQPKRPGRSNPLICSDIGGSELNCGALKAVYPRPDHFPHKQLLIIASHSMGWNASPSQCTKSCSSLTKYKGIQPGESTLLFRKHRKANQVCCLVDSQTIGQYNPTASRSSTVQFAGCRSSKIGLQSAEDTCRREITPVDSYQPASPRKAIMTSCQPHSRRHLTGRRIANRPRGKRRKSQSEKYLAPRGPPRIVF